MKLQPVTTLVPDTKVAYIGQAFANSMIADAVENAGELMKKTDIKFEHKSIRMKVSRKGS